MNLLIGKKHPWGVSCDELGFSFSNEKKFEFNEEVEDMLSDWLFDDLKILGIYASAYPVFQIFEPYDTKLAVIDPPPIYPYDYLLIIGNLRTMAQDLEKIRKSKKPVIAICDFDFLDDVERYLATGAQVITFKELRRYNK